MDRFSRRAILGDVVTGVYFGRNTIEAFASGPPQ